MTALFQAENLTKTYGRGTELCEALSSVSLNMDAGEAVAIMGPSGCGKSTLLNVLGLLTQPNQGKLFLQGDPVPENEKQRARLRNQFFGYLHQDFAIVDYQTAPANVAIPLEYAHPRIGKHQRREQALVALEKVGWIGQQEEKPAYSLVGNANGLLLLEP